MKYIIIVLVAVAALVVSTTAAYYSVTGLGALFAGASTAVIIMASALEFSKLIIASVLYRFWEDLKMFLRVYLSIALFVLVVITSVGIYGFLTSAYQETSSGIQVVDERINQINIRKESSKERLELLLAQKQQLVDNLGTLQSGLSNNKIQYKDSEGNIITSTSSANRKAIENQLKELQSRELRLDQQIDVLLNNVDSLATVELTLKTDQIAAGEVGSLKYIASITGLDLDSVVNYLILLLVVVFDPLALALVTVFNVITTNKKPKEDAIESDPSQGPVNNSTEESIIYPESFEHVLADNSPEPEIKEVEENLSTIAKEEVLPVQVDEPSDIIEEFKHPESTQRRSLRLSDISKVIRKSPELTEVLLVDGRIIVIPTKAYQKLKNIKEDSNVIRYL